MNTALQVKENSYVGTSNVIRLYRGTFDKTKGNQRSHKQKGVSSEVYAFRTVEEINSMLTVFDKHIAEAKTPTNKQVWNRNNLIFFYYWNKYCPSW